MTKTIDQFSIPQLAATLFSPFKQIDAGGSSAKLSIDVAFRRWTDRTFSRFFGAFIRFFTILAGIIVLLGMSLFGLGRILLWLLLPLLPIVGLLLSIAGIVPWK